MTVIVHGPTVPYAQVPHAVIENPNLSWKAKGLYAYLVGRPSGWVLRRGHLLKVATDGKAAIATGITELKEAGLLTSEQPRREDGTLGEVTWTVHLPEEPVVKPHRPQPDYPGPDNPAPEKPVTGKTDPLTRISITKKEVREGRAQGSFLEDDDVTPKPKRIKLPSDWQPNASHVARADDLGLKLEWEAEKFRLHAESTGRRMANWNAAFTTWLMRSREFVTNGKPDRDLRRGAPDLPRLR